jgi:hypothetical protein
MDPVSKPVVTARRQGSVGRVLALVLASGLRCVGGAPSLQAQEAPPADEVIERYVAAIGGPGAHTSPRSIRTSGVVEMPGLGLQGTFEVLQLLPNRSLTRVTIPGIGEIMSGFDGVSGWTLDPLVGASLMQGAELAQAQERANILAILRDPSLVVSRETIELSDSDGEACWSVRLVWASGGDSLDCYSRDTGLLLASEDAEVTPMGELLVTTRFSDYESFYGMMLPTRLVQSAMGQVQELNVNAVVLDDIEEAELAPPPAIQALLDGAARP